MWRFPRVSNRHGSAVCTHQCTQPTANLSMEKLEYVVVTLRVVTVSQGSVTLSTPRNRRSDQLNYVVQTCSGICAACGVGSINSPVSHPSQQTHHAGALSCSRSSRSFCQLSQAPVCAITGCGGDRDHKWQQHCYSTPTPPQGKLIGSMCVWADAHPSIALDTFEIIVTAGLQSN